MMTHKEMIHIVQTQLAIDLNCTVDDLNGEKDHVIFVDARENPGRRPYPRNERYFEILSMGKSIVVSATPERLAIAKTFMQGKDRDTIFSLPFIRGLYLHFLPDLERIQPMPPPAGFSYEVVEENEISRLMELEGLEDAIVTDPGRPYQTVLAVIAKHHGRIVGLAGACNVCAAMWQIGIEVLPEFRQMGLASYLVNRLTFEVLHRGRVPTYDVISSNIASQRVAYRVGYYPAFVTDWRVDFRDFESKSK
ncbi:MULTISPECIES: GNAT family N-acetyltransferase [Bacillales]|uniref:GNAT family N-acetyltransferase n=1 Tax=Bacillales TaxID=1385 RepID=UPI0001788538|nr:MULTISPECIES: GNAT family N-acetyltransferase [Paenibacillus]ACX66731.1 GCN5-related N-acetyltransferase [Paenibacillus sp. Y412MC10]MCM3259200.1 GNAT family N-acetyltransferase [Paenibacillus lautus]